MTAALAIIGAVCLAGTMIAVITARGIAKQEGWL